MTFEVSAFNEAALFNALSNRNCGAKEVAAQSRARYLFDYLNTIGAKTLVVEHGYTDGDYLEDFASYYVRCFQDYEKRCKRLHFFGAIFDDAEIKQFILGGLQAERIEVIQSSYCGFVVARPLPAAVVGRTVVKTYPSENGRRHYPVRREYSAHLFGAKLTVESLPFQEQDTVLAACATVALWSAFHKTSELFGTLAPRPAEITRAANGISNSHRPIPSHGLSLLQMAHAVRAVGLESETLEVRPDIPLVSLIYGHLRMGLPVILGVDVEGIGLHAITLTGYSLCDQRVNQREVAGNAQSIPLVGLRIDEFYGHDDQIGPFARLFVRPSAKDYPVTFEGSWTDPASGQTLSLRPWFVLIPVYNKIRVTYIDVLKWLERMHAVMSLIVVNSDQLEWDLHLTTTNEFKQTLRERPHLSPETYELLTEQQPRFLWRAELRHNSTPVCELLADATDMERSFPLMHISWRHPQTETLLKKLLNEPGLATVLKQTLGPRFFDFLSK